MGLFSATPSLTSSPETYCFHALCPQCVSRICSSDGSLEIAIGHESETQVSICEISRLPNNERKGYVRAPVLLRIAALAVSGHRYKLERGRGMCPSEECRG